MKRLWIFWTSWRYTSPRQANKRTLLLYQRIKTRILHPYPMQKNQKILFPVQRHLNIMTIILVYHFVLFFYLVIIARASFLLTISITIRAESSIDGQPLQVVVQPSTPPSSVIHNDGKDNNYDSPLIKRKKLPDWMVLSPEQLQKVRKKRIRELNEKKEAFKSAACAQWESETQDNISNTSTPVEDTSSCTMIVSGKKVISSLFFFLLSPLLLFVNSC